MINDFENEVWEPFLKNAVVQKSLQEMEEYGTNEIQQLFLPSH